MKVKIKKKEETKSYKLVDSWSEVKLEDWVKVIAAEEKIPSEAALENIKSISDGVCVQCITIVSVFCLLSISKIVLLVLVLSPLARPVLHIVAYLPFHATYPHLDANASDDYFLLKRPLSLIL